MELYIEPERKPYNPTNGRFLKDHVPHNKGKKMEEWMDGRKMKKVKRLAIENLENARSHNKRSDKAGRPKKAVIAVYDDGTFRMFGCVSMIPKAIGLGKENVARCCRENASGRTNQKTGKVNTDHRVGGIRFYFENDKNWIQKIKK